MSKVCFVSAGPGAADLITLRGVQRLGEAAVVLADALTDPALRAFAPKALWLDVGKRGYAGAVRQADINTLLVQHARSATGLVVRLKGGDASVFGRLEEELQALNAAGIAAEVVPGVTAAVAAAAQTQRPLTRRGVGRSVALHTAMTRDGTPARHPAEGTRADTEVFYMAGRQLAALRRRLLAAGWPAHTASTVVSRAGCFDALSSWHALERLSEAALLHHGRPLVVTVGVGAHPVGAVAPDTPGTQENPVPLLESAASSGPPSLP